MIFGVKDVNKWNNFMNRVGFAVNIHGDEISFKGDDLHRDLIKALRQYDDKYKGRSLKDLVYDKEVFLCNSIEECYFAQKLFNRKISVVYTRGNENTRELINHVKSVKNKYKGALYEDAPLGAQIVLWIEKITGTPYEEICEMHGSPKGSFSYKEMKFEFGKNPVLTEKTPIGKMDELYFFESLNMDYLMTHRKNGSRVLNIFRSALFDNNVNPNIDTFNPFKFSLIS